MELHIVNPDPRYEKAQTIEPTTRGYVYIAAAVRPGRFPLVLPSKERQALIDEVKQLADQLEHTEGVVKATVFRAVVIAPTLRFSSYLRQRRDSLHVANFDVAVLVETTSPAASRAVQSTPAFAALIGAIQKQAEAVRVIEARNARRIGDVDTTRKGLFLFNHFAADDRRVMLELWEYLAGWYAVETGLDNSVALVPVDSAESDYAVVNWARWGVSPLRHFWSQLSKKTFRSYVTANLEANRAASMPIYYRLA
jgi:hypothetical protein